MTAKPRLGIIAGGGDLPVRLAEYSTASGHNPYILGVEGFANPDFVARYNGSTASIGEIGRQLESLRNAKCEQLVFAGIVRRPDFKNLRVDARGALALPKLMSAAVKGDDALLRATISIFESEGFEVIGADDVCSELLAKPGAFGAIDPSKKDHEDIQIAATAARRLGELDIGQGAVCRDGVVLAVEAQEGTDAMLERCATLRTPDQTRGVLVKIPKPSQERRIDLPTIGLETLRRAADAGLVGIAIEANGALVLDQDELRREADEREMFIWGICAEQTT